MNIPILSRTSSLHSSQEYEIKAGTESQDKKSTLASSFNNYSEHSHKSSASLQNFRSFSSPEASSPLPILQEKFPPQKHLCARHNKKYAYSCVTCIGSVCSECLHDPTQHRGHRFQRYNEKKESLRMIRNELSNLIRMRRDEISEFVNYQQKVKAGKVELSKNNLQRLQTYSKRIASTYDAIEMGENECNSYKTILKQFNEYYDLSLAQLKNTTQVTLICTTGTQIFQSFNSKIKQVSETTIAPTKLNSLNILKPGLCSNFFALANFTEAKERGQEKIFQAFEVFNSLWRLKVYPSGYSGAKVDEKHSGIQYMSVYVERVDGALDASTFVIQIETTSRLDPRLKIKKQFQSQFTKNESWGYDRFTRLSNIYQHGFLGQDDTLFIKVSISPASYYEAVRCLSAIISYKEKAHQDNERRIKILKALLRKKKQTHTIHERLPHLSMSSQKPRKFAQGIEKKIQLNEKLSIQAEIEFFKHYSPEQVNERADDLAEYKSQPSSPWISIYGQQPPKLIRLVSLKNKELIENSKKKLHVRNHTFY